jgi:adenylosuccinate lyase
MKAWDEGGDLKSLVSADQDINGHLSREQVDRVFNLETYLRNVDQIFTRVFD